MGENVYIVIDTGELSQLTEKSKNKKKIYYLLSFLYLLLTYILLVLSLVLQMIQHWSHQTNL
jgi:hypothetical protein